MEKTINPALMQVIAQAVPLLMAFPTRHVLVDYDQEADVLYISFARPQKATETELTDEGLLLRYRHKRLVGVTVLDASTRVAP